MAGEDDGNGRVGLARVEWQLGQLKEEVSSLKASVSEMVREAVLRRVVDLESRVSRIEEAKQRDQDDRGKERRGNWTQVAMLVGGVFLGVLANYVRSGK